MKRTDRLVPLKSNVWVPLLDATWARRTLANLAAQGTEGAALLSALQRHCLGESLEDGETRSLQARRLLDADGKSDYTLQQVVLSLHRAEDEGPAPSGPFARAEDLLASDRHLRTTQRPTRNR
jgi:hypothetical protein